MPISTTPASGWDNCLRLSNSDSEVIITTDVGPRVIAYRLAGGRNVFKEYTEQSGQSGEETWQIRGGHRLWTAPEDVTTTYIPDNDPVPHLAVGDSTVHLANLASDEFPIRKDMVVTIAPTGSRVRIDHKITNESGSPLSVAPWALSVMDAGAVEIIPEPSKGIHPLDLLPNRRLILWPFTSMADSRLRFSRDFILLSQTACEAPIKFGLTHRVGWVACAFSSLLFIKSVEFSDAVTYPDDDCNFETFTNSDMLEIETLGPLRNLQPGESSTLAENWWLYETGKPMPSDPEQLGEWLAPWVVSSGLCMPGGTR